VSVKSRTAAILCVVAQGDPASIESISDLLAAHSIEVVASATDGATALAAIEAHSPTVAILDLFMRRLGGIEVARLALQQRPETATILFCPHSDRGLLVEAVDAGVRGFVRKEGTPEELLRVVELAATEAAYVDPLFASTLVRGSATRLPRALSAREREILRLLADGKTNEKIGEALHISPHTVRTHLRRAMQKLEADNRTQAVAIAL
jgi:DNA-binding NarL/FixJ family response regulator